MSIYDMFDIEQWIDDTGCSRTQAEIVCENWLEGQYSKREFLTIEWGSDIDKHISEYEI